MISMILLILHTQMGGRGTARDSTNHSGKKKLILNSLTQSTLLTKEWEKRKKDLYEKHAVNQRLSERN